MKYFRFQKAQRIGYRNITEHFNGKPDLIHLNVAFPAGLFAMKLKKRENLEYILTEHSTKYHIPTNPLESYCTKKICKKATVICPVSSDLKKVMEEKGYGKKFEVVPNVVDTDLFRIAEKKVSRKKKVIHISTLIEWQKNISGILNVIKRLSETRNDFELDIVCEQDSRDAVALAKQHGIFGTVVHFHPAQPLPEVARMLGESNIFLMFSNVENLPCVVIESFASGVPVVSSSVGGIPEMINETNGMLVDAKDENSLFEKLNSMLDKHMSYDKEDLRRSAIEQYSYEAVGKKFSDIYSRIVQNKLQ
jgi:glycosyltransferase involved in cell wall biosynthesis